MISVLLAIFAVSASADSPYKILLVDERWESRPFVIEVPETNKRGYENLEKTLFNREGYMRFRENGLPYLLLPIGPISPTTPAGQHGWHFRFQPEKINFSQTAIELCDGNFEYVENNPGDFKRAYCPWNAPNLVREIWKGRRLLWRRR